ncbi:hypothetical protein BU16DRAFT_555582 [Lophium mytilinum]|uniref:Uncharacterized protein n=1 Tax=Lophium mytilinum TaxID=390894 RepID=A0A6A6R8E8_9PEZI|nr:hypothetical protein BU16DRAFT_555582 [Lophium mytilinum]
MAACVDYLKTLLGATGENALPPAVAAGIKSLPSGSLFNGATVCDLSAEKQQDLKTILTEYLSRLPDHIQRQLAKHCTFQKSAFSTIIAFLFARKEHIAYATTGALSLTVVGYLAVQHFNRYVEKVRMEEREWSFQQLARLSGIVQAEEREKYDRQLVRHVKDVRVKERERYGQLLEKLTYQWPETLSDFAEKTEEVQVKRLSLDSAKARTESAALETPERTVEQEESSVATDHAGKPGPESGEANEGTTGECPMKEDIPELLIPLSNWLKDQGRLESEGWMVSDAAYRAKREARLKAEDISSNWELVENTEGKESKLA